MTLRLLPIVVALCTMLCTTQNTVAASPFSPISIGLRAALASRANDFSSSSTSTGIRIGYVKRQPPILEKEKHQSPIVAVVASTDSTEIDFRGGANVGKSKPPAFLKWAYKACGVATTAAWSTCVYIAIRSNQPMGAVMPSWQHGFFARIGALSPVPVIVASYKALISASDDSWEELSSPTCRRLNLAMATATAGSALWVKYAHIITQIPGTEPLVSHIGFSGPSSLPRTALIAAYGSAAILSAVVWVRSLPEQDRKNPLSWPRRVVDGVAQSLVSLAPESSLDPVQVKYSLLTSGFLFFTGMQLCAQHPVSAVFSWTARRLPRAFPAWTLLASAVTYDLKEAAESGILWSGSSRMEARPTYRRDLSNSIRGFGALYLVGKIGPVLFDPSWPGGFKVPTAVPGWAVAAILTMAYTLRSDQP